MSSITSNGVFNLPKIREEQDHLEKVYCRIQVELEIFMELVRHKRLQKSFKSMLLHVQSQTQLPQWNGFHISNEPSRFRLVL